MNEGTTDLRALPLMTRLHERGEVRRQFPRILQSHTKVVFRPDFDDSILGFQPHALGFAIMQDIERLVTIRRTGSRLGSPISRHRATVRESFASWYNLSR